MKKKIISLLMIVIVIAATFFYSYIDKNVYLYDRNADTSNFYGTGVLVEGDEFAQTFVAKEDCLDGVNIKTAVAGNVENVKVHVELYDEDMNVVAETSVKGSQLENNKFNIIKFTKVKDTKDKQYTLVISEENSDEQNGVGFYCVSEEGTLVARTISKGFDLETFFVALGMIAFIVVFMKILIKYFK